jgi:dihydropyrimidinase
MSTVIKGGTIVTADRHLQGGHQDRGLPRSDTRSGPDFHGDEVLDAAGCYVMPGGIDPHTHLEMPFMGTYSADDFESGTRAALAGGTTMVVDFCLPDPGQSLLEALKMLGQQVDQRQLRLLLPHVDHLVGRAGLQRDEGWSRKSGINTFKHFMAYKGALMVNDDEMFASFQRCAALGALPLVHAENGDVVAAAGRS